VAFEVLFPGLYLITSGFFSGALVSCGAGFGGGVVGFSIGLLLNLRSQYSTSGCL
jgi:hypothetical protein